MHNVDRFLFTDTYDKLKPLERSGFNIARKNLTVWLYAIGYRLLRTIS